MYFNYFFNFQQINQKKIFLKYLKKSYFKSIHLLNKWNDYNIYKGNNIYIQICFICYIFYFFFLIIFKLGLFSSFIHLPSNDIKFWNWVYIINQNHIIFYGEINNIESFKDIDDIFNNTKSKIYINKRIIKLLIKKIKKLKGEIETIIKQILNVKEKKREISIRFVILTQNEIKEYINEMIIKKYGYNHIEIIKIN